MSTETWSDDARTPPVAIVGPAPVNDPLGRTTVLPRLELQGDAPVLVSAREVRYDELFELGRGGLGVVFGARDRDIGRRVAIKQLRDDRRSPKAALRFAEEIRTIGQLDHPNIAPIHDVGTDAEGRTYFVMKFVAGQTMASVIDALRRQDADAVAHWTVTRRIEVFRKVLEAVGFAHARGVVHRDLKPENLMIGEHGEVTVLDWGIALRDAAPSADGLEGDEVQARVTQTRDGAVIGTPAYMSPEQARGRPVDARTDVYSLGVVLYEWLAARHPLADVEGDVQDLLDAVADRPLPGMSTWPSAGIPAEYGWVIAAATGKDPSARLPSIDALLERIDAAQSGEFAVQCPVTFQKSLLHRALRLIDRVPLLTVVVFAALVAGVVALVVGMLFAFTLGAVLV